MLRGTWARLPRGPGGLHGGTPHVDNAAQLENHAVDRGGTTWDQVQCSSKAIFNYMDQEQSDFDKMDDEYY